MKIFITSIRARGGTDEAEVTFGMSSDDGENSSVESFVLSVAQFMELGVCEGESSRESYDSVSHASKVWDAAKRGIYILGYGAASARSLRTKLVAKGYERSVAAEAVEMLGSRGLIREREDAARAAQLMAAKLWGRRRIASGLYEKGYDAESVSHAMNELEDAGIDFFESCKELISRRYMQLIGDRESEKKLFACVTRYGYSASEIRDAIHSLKQDAAR